MSETAEERRLRVIDEITPDWRKALPDEDLIPYYNFCSAISELRGSLSCKLLNMDITKIADEVYEEVLRISEVRLSKEVGDEGA